MEMTEDNFSSDLPQEDGIYYSSQSQTLSGFQDLPHNR
jgi:hypothetical protein